MKIRTKQTRLFSPKRKTRQVRCTVKYGSSPVGHTVDVKPLSTNRAWQGRRFKTPEYKAFEKEVLYLLPAMPIPAPPYKVSYEFGFSNKLSDADNSLKQFQDILVKKYGFDDRDIYEIVIKKKIVEKGKEYISFVIETLV